MAFFTIVMSPGLSKPQHRRAALVGPPAVASTGPVDEQMSAAGFDRVQVVDVTEQFLATARAWLAELEDGEKELRPMLGDAEYAQKRRDRKEIIAGTEEGLLVRLLVAGVA